MGTSIKKVADECGLAASTVRNILSSANKVPYSQKSVDLVKETAKQLGYKPNRFAQMFRKGQSDSLGLLMPNLQDHYYMEIVDRLIYGFEDLGLSLIMKVLHQKTREQALRTYESILSWRVKAFLVILHAQDVVHLEDIKSMKKDTLLITLNNNSWKGCSAVWPNRQKIAELAVKHLTELGHRRIGMLGYPVPNHDISTVTSNARTRRLHKELRKIGLKLKLKDIFLCDFPEISRNYNSEGFQGLRLGKHFAHIQDRPTALVAWNEQLANQFIAGFQSEGGRIPKDISILTYNNSRFAATASMPLTAVGVSSEKYAEATLALIREGLMAMNKDGESIVKELKLEPELVVRSTTGHFVNDNTMG